MKSCSLLLALLLTTVGLFGQTNIHGLIVDEHEQGVLYANVLLYTADSSFLKGAVTDEAGRYVFNDLPPAVYYLVAESLGYSSGYSSSFIIADKGTKRIDPIQIQPDVQALEEVTVIARKPLFEQQLDRLVVNVQQSITNAGATALEVLERSPGLSIDRVNQLISLQGKSSVLVMINGKINRLDAATLIQMLAGMPAANIERIELITTPPANYEAEGDAGIINIILLHQQEEGWNASWTNTAGYGKRPKWGSSANVFWRSGNWGIYTNLGTNSDYSLHSLQLNRENFGDSQQILGSELRSSRPVYLGFHNLRLGVDYQMSAKTSWSLLYATHRSEWELDALTITRMEENQVNYSRSELRSLESNTWNHSMGSLAFQQEFAAGEKLSFTTDYLHYFDDNPTDYEEVILEQTSMQESRQLFQSRKETPVNFWVATLDFEHQKQDNWQWQTGLKTTLSRFQNKVNLNYFTDNKWYSDENFSDLFSLKENIYAAYWTGTLQLDKAWQLKLGGRYEYLDSRRISQRDGNLPGQRYGRLFPSFYLSNAISDEQKWSLAYSERITRPSFNILAPAFFFFGPNTVLSGNPAILQTISRQLSTEYRYKTLQTSIRITDDTNPIAWGQPIIDPATNVLLIKALNMLDQKTAALNVHFPLIVNSWWTSRYQLSGNWLRQVQLVEGQVMQTESNFFSFNTTHNFTLADALTAELKARANSPLKYGLGKIPWLYGIDLGLQKTFGAGRHKLSFSWTDIFNTNNVFSIETDRPDLHLYLNWCYENEGSIKRLTYTWQFGQQSLEKETRKSTSSEEQGRVN